MIASFVDWPATLRRKNSIAVVPSHSQPRLASVLYTMLTPRSTALVNTAVRGGRKSIVNWSAAPEYPICSACAT